MHFAVVVVVVVVVVVIVIETSIDKLPLLNIEVLSI